MDKPEKPEAFIVLNIWDSNGEIKTEFTSTPRLEDTEFNGQPFITPAQNMALKVKKFLQDNFQDAENGNGRTTNFTVASVDNAENNNDDSP